ncbi:hypothetical protein K7X08_027772 [Anisodus acutangulus]|uniref:Uncharacterized protein n=1 Tax=Anisodus acutangulus TaxID=402998 RepID=A0A9Q1LMC8_9SOLA|nr:hypothetical protein K7X08_027772 [Anisodus acutangulus]
MLANESHLVALPVTSDKHCNQWRTEVFCERLDLSAAMPEEDEILVPNSGFSVEGPNKPMEVVYMKNIFRCSARFFRPSVSRSKSHNEPFEFAFMYGKHFYGDLIDLIMLQDFILNLLALLEFELHYRSVFDVAIDNSKRSMH